MLLPIGATVRTGQRGDEYFQLDDAPTRADILPAPVPTPEQMVELRETLQALEQALNELPPDQRLAFVLHAIEGMGYAEIAAITHQPRSAVKAAYHAAREALRQRFADQFLTAEDASAQPALKDEPSA